MDDAFCFRHWAGWLVMHCLLGFRARGWFPCHRQATKVIFFKITINLQFLSICGGLFLVSTMVLTFFKRENKRSQIATEEPPGLVATYKYTTAFIWIIFIERIYGNPEPKTKLNMILTFSRVVWNILRHPLMLPTILLLMIYKVSSPSSLFSWSTRFSLSQVGFSTGEVVTSLKLVEVGIGKVFVKNISGEPPKNKTFFWEGKGRFSGWFCGVRGRFGNQPPHPPIFGKVFPKKLFFWGGLPLDAISKFFQLSRAGAILNPLHTGRSASVNRCSAGTADGSC